MCIAQKVHQIPLPRNETGNALWLFVADGFTLTTGPKMVAMNFLPMQSQEVQMAK